MTFQQELQKAIPYLKGWQKQNNEYDLRSNFIYTTTDFSEVLENSKRVDVPISYVCHRWYNFHTSKETERIFIKHGCIKEENDRHKEIDLYFKSISYDVKLTVYPSKFQEKIDIKKRIGRDTLIDWYYKNQSQEGRKHLANRLFVVCMSKDNSKSSIENLKLKCRFDLIDSSVKKFVNYYSQKELNQIQIKDKDKNFIVYSDLLLVSG